MRKLGVKRRKLNPPEADVARLPPEADFASLNTGAHPALPFNFAKGFEELRGYAGPGGSE